MKIIFLDIDGVLNSCPVDKMDPVQLSQKRMIMIADLARETGAQIVISSTWRKGHSLKYFKMIFWHFTNLVNGGLYGEHDGYDYYQPNWYESPDFIIGKTPVFNMRRGFEIEYWLEAHAGFVSNYIIIDDDSDMLPHQMSHFVKTNGYLGITKKDIEKAKRILS